MRIDLAKIDKIFRMRFFLLKYSLKSTLQFVIKNVIGQREVCLPAAEAITFSSPAGHFSELSHSIKAWYWLSFYCVIERFSPFTTFLYSISSTLQFGMKNKHICQRKVCLWSAQKRPNGSHLQHSNMVRWATA